MVKPIDTGADDAPVVNQQVGGPSVAAQMLSPTVAGAAYEGLAKVAGQLSDIGENMLKPEMADKGTAAVGRDPVTGDPTFEARTPLNDLDVAYNHAGQAAFLSASEGDRRSYLQQLAIDNIDDPAQFRDLATKYVKTQAGGSGVPTGLRGDLLNTGLDDVNQFGITLATNKQARDTKNNFDTIHSAAKNTANDILAMSRNLQAGTPEYAAAVGKYQHQLMTVKNPIFASLGITTQKLDDELADTMNSAEAESVIGHALQIAKTGGPQGAEQAVQFVDQAMWSPSLNLTREQRDAFGSEGKSAIREWAATQRDALTQLAQSVDQRFDAAKAKALATGEWRSVVSPTEIGSAFQNDPTKAKRIVGELTGAAQIHSMQLQVLNAKPADMVAMDQQYNPANAKGPSSGFEGYYEGFLAPHEGGYVADDGNGHPANFGINQGANPTVDVSKLTRSGAKQLVHDNYWVASGADQMPPALAAVQADTAVNMGVGTANKILAQSGGDPQKYLDLREAAYQRIASAHPSQAQHLPVWLQRNSDLRGYIQGNGDPEDFATKEATYSAFLKAKDDRQQALTKDSAGFTFLARPDIAASITSTDPATIQHGVSMSLQAQRDFGVIAPRILSDGQASTFLQQFNNPADANRPADNMIRQMSQLSAAYGTYMPQVFQELQKKGLPPEASALYVTNQPGSAVAANRVATAINSMSHMGKDMNAGRDAFFNGAPNNSAINKALPGMMDDYNASLVGVGDGPQRKQTMTYAVNLLAHQYAYEGINDPNKAVQLAHDDLIGGQYRFVDGYRVPKGIDASVIQQGANAVKGNLPSANLEPYANAAPGVSIDDRRAMSAKILSGQGRWITRSDDKGLYLAWPQASGYMPAIDAKGRPLTFSWSALRAAGQKNPVGGNNPYSAAFEAGAGGN